MSSMVSAGHALLSPLFLVSGALSMVTLSDPGLLDNEMVATLPAFRTAVSLVEIAVGGLLIAVHLAATDSNL